MFIVSKTYDVVTDESARVGDYAESGFVYDARPMSLREVIDEIKTLSGFENFRPKDLSQSLYEVDPIIDCVDGSETREALHIDGNERAMRRLNRVIASKFLRAD